MNQDVNLRLTPAGIAGVLAQAKLNPAPLKVSGGVPTPKAKRLSDLIFGATKHTRRKDPPFGCYSQQVANLIEEVTGEKIPRPSDLDQKSKCSVPPMLSVVRLWPSRNDNIGDSVCLVVNTKATGVLIQTSIADGLGSKIADVQFDGYDFIVDEEEISKLPLDTPFSNCFGMEKELLNLMLTLKLFEVVPDSGPAPVSPPSEIDRDANRPLWMNSHDLGDEARSLIELLSPEELPDVSTIAMAYPTGMVAMQRCFSAVHSRGLEGRLHRLRNVAAPWPFIYDNWDKLYNLCVAEDEEGVETLLHKLTR